MANEKLEQITASNKTIEVEGVDFTLNPLSVRQFTQAQLKGEDNEAEALIEMMYFSLEEEEDISRKELREAPAKLLVPLQEAVMELNDFEDFFDEEDKQEALEKLR